MLRRIQFFERLLEGCGVGCNLRMLHAGVCGGQAGIGFLHALFNGGKLASFEVRELLSSGACGVSGVSGVGRTLRLVLRLFLLLFHPVFPLCIVCKTTNVSAAIETEDSGGDAVQQIAVVGNQHQRTGKVEQIFFQDFERGNIQIVGRLIEQQNVGRLQHQPGDEHPRPLAAGEVAHRLIQLLASKQEAGSPTCHVHDPSLVHD